MPTPEFFAKDSETLEEVSVARVGKFLRAYKPHTPSPRATIEELAKEAKEWSDGTRKPDASWVDAPDAIPRWEPPDPPPEPRMYEEFRHYKGGLYKVFSLAWDTRHNHWAVVYVSQKGNWWIRPHSMFVERVEQDGKSLPRFARLF